MNFIRASTVALMICASVLSSIDIRRTGWLDRLVQYKKAEFINDVRKVAPATINATIIPKPRGYTDSSKWNFDSVMHLLVLLKHSEAAAPVHRALRRVMRPNRRLMMSMADSFKHFPSLSKQSLNEMYYDVGSEEDYIEEPKVLEDGVVVVTNPVEARLPSAQISIKLLKEILISRAIAAREMPSTMPSSIPWIPMNKTYGPYDNEGGGDGTGEPCGTGATEGDAEAAEDATTAAGEELAAAEEGGAVEGGAEEEPAAEKEPE